MKGFGAEDGGAAESELSIFDLAIKGASDQYLRRAFDCPRFKNVDGARVLSARLLDGDSKLLRAEMIDLFGVPIHAASPKGSLDRKFPPDDDAPELTQSLDTARRKAFVSAADTPRLRHTILQYLWLSACNWNKREDTHFFPCPDVAACVVAAFVREGMPLRDSDAVDTRFRCPLAIALQSGAMEFAQALLDLPPRLAFDVNNFRPDRGPLIGLANCDYGISGEVFEVLLKRTDRSVVSSGCVLVDEGEDQYTRKNVHILVSRILRCISIHIPSNVMPSLRRLIAHAEPDGDGFDLTGGIARRALAKTEEKLLRSRGGGVLRPGFKLGGTILWPGFKFGGAIVLLENLCDHLSGFTMTIQAGDARILLARLAEIKEEMIRAMRRIRTHRRALRPTVAQLLGSAGITMPGLHQTLCCYALPSLVDESQLDHPLITTMPAPTIASFP